MKAALLTGYGPPDVIQIREIAKPVPKDHEILVKVHAACVGPSDCAFRKGDPFIVRLIYGLRRPRNPLQGVEVAGVVEAVGKDVTSFRPGDRVAGMDPNSFGAHAEYRCLREDAPVVGIADTMGFAEAVGLYDGGLTALTFLRDEAKIQAGQRVLINGASGAVGAYAVQLAKHFGTHVTGVCSGANRALVESLGADQVIDYTREDFAARGETYDIIFDAVGKRSFSQCNGALTQNGVYLTTVPTLGIVLDMVWTSVRGGKRAKFTAAGLRQNKANLRTINELAAAGGLRAVIDRCYPLEQIAGAHRYVDTERKKGNVIIVVAG